MTTMFVSRVGPTTVVKLDTQFTQGLSPRRFLIPSGHAQLYPRKTCVLTATSPLRALVVIILRKRDGCIQSF